MKKTRNYPGPPISVGGAKRVLKFGAVFPKTTLETPRLRLLPAIGDHRIRQAFELIQPPDLKAGLNLPQDLSLSEFRKKLIDNEPFAFFLLEEKTSGNLVGLLGAWTICPIRGWAQILYGLSAGFRGNGYAKEGSEALIKSLFRSELVKGVGAIVVGPNPQSHAVLGKLGMTSILKLGDREFFGLSRASFERRGASLTAKHPDEQGAQGSPIHGQVVLALLKKLVIRLSTSNRDSPTGKLAAAACSVLLR